MAYALTGLTRAVLVTALVYLAADAVVIPLVMRPLFAAQLGPQMLETLRLGPAAAFYLIHLAGLVHFAVRPALAARAPRLALRDGAILGCVAYSCYEMTSWTIMRDWSAVLVAVDLVWGTLISGVAAWGGVRVAIRRFGCPAAADASLLFPAEPKARG